MKKEYFIEFLAGSLSDELRDDFPLTMDYDDNTWLWIERGRKFANKIWPTIKLLETNQTKTPKDKTGVEDAVK